MCPLSFWLSCLPLCGTGLTRRFRPADAAPRRLTLEAELIPGVAEYYAGVRLSAVLAARAMVRRAVERGDLPQNVEETLLLDTLTGGAMMHALTTPPERRADLAKHSRAHADRLVGFLLRAVCGPHPAAGG